MPQNRFILDAPLVLTTYVLKVLHESHKPSNCFSDWLGLGLPYLRCKIVFLPCILNLACWNHTEPRMVKPEANGNTCVSNCIVRKFSLGVHYALLVFTQNNLDSVYAKYQNH